MEGELFAYLFLSLFNNSFIIWDDVTLIDGMNEL